MKKNYKTPIKNLAGAALVLLALLMSFSVNEIRANGHPANPFGLQAEDVSRCQVGPVTLIATVDSDFNEDNIRWYEEPFYGTPVASGPEYHIKEINDDAIFFIDYIEDGECGICDRIAVRVFVFYDEVENTIFYDNNVFCDTTTEPQEVTLSGTRGGTFSAEPDGLELDAETGAITPSGSSIGNYQITYTPPEIDGCANEPAVTDVEIIAQPDDPTISYPESAYCTSEAGIVEVNRTGADFGSYSAEPLGLAINSTTGEVNPSQSQGGTYTITYDVPGLGGCIPQTATTTLTIEQISSAVISYNQPFCGNDDEQEVSLTGTEGGSFTYVNSSGDIEGLTIDDNDGKITPSTSDPGAYTVTYTIAATEVCPEVVAETSVTIHPVPEATIAATATDVFAGIDDDVIVTFTGSTGVAPYIFAYTLGDTETTIASDATGVATVTQVTLVPGTYTYTLVSVTDANDCSAEVSDQSVVITVNSTPVAEFSYPNTPYCQDSGIATPTFIGQIGDFTVSPTATFHIDGQGKITLATSDPGTYEVTNTVAGGVSHTTEITITKTPNPAFTYTKTSFCPGTDDYAAPTITDSDFEGEGVFTANSANLVFATVTGTVTPGTIDVNASFPGNYEITYTLPASGGCPEVSHTISITIDTPPAVISPRDYIICSGEELQIGFESDPPGALFEWKVTSIDGDISGATLNQGNTTTEGNNTITFTLTNSSVTQAGEMVLTVTPTVAGGACSTGPAVEVVVTVRPIPQLSSTLTPPTICSGVLFEYTPESEHEAAGFSWSRAGVAEIEEAAGEGTGAVSETLTNISTAPVDVTYVYTTSADGCSLEENVVVTVNPLGQVDTVSDEAVCYNTEVGPFNFTTDNTGGTTTYEWTNDNENIGLATSGTGNISAFTVTNTTLATITATITVTPSFENGGIVCVGAPVSFTITVYPPPATPTTDYDDNTRTVGYTGDEFIVTATTTTAGATIKWYTDAEGTTTTTAPAGTETGTYTAWAEAEHDVTGCVSTQRIEVTLIIAPVIIDNKGYFNLNDAFKAIEEGTHTGHVVVEIYANTVEDDGAELDLTDVENVNSVEIKAMNPDVTITGGVTLTGSSDEN